MSTNGNAPGDELIGRSLGGYRVLSRIGSGATGVVFRAQHPEQSRQVALKVLHDNLGTISSLKRRFEREARVLAKLDHPNVVYIVDYGFIEGHTFIAMELLEGETLEQILEEAPIALHRVIPITKQVLAGLGFAHVRQVVHRDLKPANVFLCRTDGEAPQHVKLLDFGLAKMLSADDVSGDGTLTRRGRIVGTPAYMAPEQITGVSLDVRADIYALGILLYEMIADRRPFLSERRSELLRAHLLEPVPPLIEARKDLVVHPQLEAIVLKALAKDPANRFADAAEMLAAFDQLPADPVRLDVPKRIDDRARLGATSEIISSSERRALSESAGLPANAPTPSPWPPAIDDDAMKRNAESIRRELSSRPSASAVRPSTSQPKLPDAAPTRKKKLKVRRRPFRVSTPALYVISLLLFAIAATLSFFDAPPEPPRTHLSARDDTP